MKKMNNKEYFEHEKERTLKRIKEAFDEAKKLYGELAIYWHTISGAENFEELEKDVKRLNNKTNNFKHIFWR